MAKRRAGFFLRIFLFTGLLTAVLGILGCGFTIDYDSYALVYGISDYLPATINDLDYCHLDASDMEALLQSRGFLVVSRTDNPSSGTSNVTRTQIESDISSVAAQAKPEDLFIFFFSGHGHFVSSSGSEPPEGDILDEVIVLNDPGPPVAVDYLTDDELAALIRQISCMRKVVIIDACYSGGIIGNSLETDRIPPDYDGFVSRPGVLESAITLYANFTDETADISPYDALVISASGEMEYSFESPSISHGVFTYYLLEAADRGDFNRDGYLTVVEAFSYVRKAIDAVWNPEHPFNQFSPHVSGGPVDFVLFPVP
jgi:hypothetical protein